MLISNNVSELKYLYYKKFRKARLNSAILSKRYKNIIKPINKHFSMNHQIKYRIKSSKEKNKRMDNNNNSSSLSEKDKNFLVKNPPGQTKIHNSNDKIKTDDKTIPIKFESNIDIKNKSAVIKYRGNYKMNLKSFSYKQTENKHINGINRGKLKNTLFIKIFKKMDFSKDKLSCELLYQDILKNTFKEALNKISVEKQKTKEEYNREMNKINNYLSFQNKENEILVSYNKNFEPLLINNSSYISNSTDNKITANKYFTRFKKTNSAKYKRNKQNFQNKSIDNIYSKFFDSNKIYSDLKNQNLKYKNQEYTKSNLLSFYSNNKLNKNEDSKTKFDFSRDKKINSSFQMQNNIISNNNKKLTKSKNKDSLKIENSKQEMIIKFNNFLNKYKLNKLNDKNQKISKRAHKNGKGILFSNKLINKKINQRLFNPNKLKLIIYKRNEIIKSNKQNKYNNNLINNENRDISHNNLNPEIENKSKDLSFQTQSKNNISFLKNSHSENIIFKNKLNNNSYLIDEESKNNNKQKKKKLIENYPDLFDIYKDFRLIKNEEEYKRKKNMKRAYNNNNKLSSKIKKSKEEKNINGIKDEKYEKKIKEINNKVKARKNNK